MNLNNSISEIQLKEIYRAEKFSKSNLRSTTGAAIEIIKAGDTNSDSGPDFKNALIKINGKTLRGDIEFHKKSSEWYSHEHYTDRRYNAVVLQIVSVNDSKEAPRTESGRVIETVELTRFLLPDAESILQLRKNSDREFTLRCSEKNGEVSRDIKLEYLKRLGEKRFLHKVGRYEERLKDIIDENRPVVFETKQRYFRDFSELAIEHRTYSTEELKREEYWDQLLYEGVIEGLGYSKNTITFRKLSQNVSLKFLTEQSKGKLLNTEAIFFGVAGLLPGSYEKYDDESRLYIKNLSLIWEDSKKSYKREHIDETEWLFHRLRPQNFPTVRLAGASILFSKRLRYFSARLLLQDAAEKDDAGFIRTWRDFLIVPSGGYWANHYVFGTRAASRLRMLIGAGRANEIIVNVVLPLLYLRGKTFELPYFQDKAIKIMEQFHPLEDNNLTLAMKEQLFDGDNVFESVLHQQGAIQLYRTLCSERRCSRCKIGKQVFEKNQVKA
ncbi:MAG: DUF2851 family protein [Candidatus Kryptoniota bacterium]